MTANSKNWSRFISNKIPSSLKLQPVIYNFIKKDSKIIDIGCGFGKTVFELYRNGYRRIYGGDCNKNGIEFANLYSKKLKLRPAPEFKIFNAISIP